MMVADVKCQTPSRRKTMPLPNHRTTVTLIAFGVFALCGSYGHPAQAQQKDGGITISEVNIVGRVQKPVASVDVSKIQPKLTVAELRQPGL